MKIAVFGGTGFIGKRLMDALKAKGWEAVALDTRKGAEWKTQIKDADAVINLAGHPLFKNRWTTEVKALIYDSRIEGTHQIVQELNPQKTKVFINASAIGVYGTGEKPVDESSRAADDYLARVCKDWEEEAASAVRLKKIRTVIVRFGVVLGKNGGALEKLIPPFKFGVGGTIGLSGSQTMSWVHIDDVVGIILLAIENKKAAPVMNATSPHPVSNKVFSQTLGKVLHRPSMFPVPKLALYLLVGEAAQIISAGQNVLPQATQASGYTFKYPELEAALKNILT